jgi:hypothetical protein
MKLDAECGCGASINLDSGTSGPGAYPYVPEGKIVDTFKAWMVEHQLCRERISTAAPTPGENMELGTTVSDVISGFKGVVTGVVNYLSGCSQAFVVPRVGDDGRFVDGQWFDLQRLVVEPVPKVELNNGATPGFDAAPPRRT